MQPRFKPQSYALCGEESRHQGITMSFLVATPITSGLSEVPPLLDQSRKGYLHHVNTLEF
jgi:hypothetical protein